MPLTKQKIDSYMAEHDANADVFRICEELYLAELDFLPELPLQNINEMPFIPHRRADLLVAITDDIIRYAKYHNLEKNDNQLYSVAEAVRSSFFVKWILKMKPCYIDTVVDYTNYKSVEFNKEIPKYDRLVCFCNESIALIAINVISGIDLNNQHSLENSHTNNLFGLLYSFRYRTNHQDNYTSLIYQIEQSVEKI